MCSFTESDLSGTDNIVPFENTTPIHLINLLCVLLFWPFLFWLKGNWLITAVVIENTLTQRRLHWHFYILQNLPRIMGGTGTRSAKDKLHRHRRKRSTKTGTRVWKGTGSGPWQTRVTSEGGWPSTSTWMGRGLNQGQIKVKVRSRSRSRLLLLLLLLSNNSLWLWRAVTFTVREHCSAAVAVFHARPSTPGWCPHHRH